MYWSFFDDSGDWNNSDFVCLAGYLSDENGWNGFTAKWKNLLLKHKLPYMHTKDFLFRQGPYKELNLSVEQMKEIYEQFIAVIREHVLIGFGFGVDAKYFRGMASPAQKRMGDPFLLCFQRLMRNLVNRMKDAGFVDAIPIIFDDSEKYSHKVYRCWSGLRKQYPDMKRMISAVTFADDEIYYPLQGADILANETIKHLRNLAADRATRPQLGNLLKTLDDPDWGIEYIGELWDGPELERAYKELSESDAKLGIIPPTGYL